MRPKGTPAKGQYFKFGPSKKVLDMEQLILKTSSEELSDKLIENGIVFLKADELRYLLRVFSDNKHLQISETLKYFLDFLTLL
jgi:hypothetical protein